MNFYQQKLQLYFYQHYMKCDLVIGEDIPLSVFGAF